MTSPHAPLSKGSDLKICVCCPYVSPRLLSAFACHVLTLPFMLASRKHSFDPLLPKFCAGCSLIMEVRDIIVAGRQTHLLLSHMLRIPVCILSPYITYEKFPCFSAGAKHRVSAA